VNPNANVTTFSSTTPWERINVKIPSAFFVANCKIGLELTNSWGIQVYYIDDFSVEEFTPTTITSVASGAWSNPATWSGNIVPTANNHVVIASGHTVQVDVNIARMQNLTIDGVFTYSTISATQLAQVFGNITISPTGSLLSLSGTTGKMLYVNGSLTNNGFMNFQPGTSAAGGICWTGYDAVYSGTGVINNNRVPVVVHAVGNTVQYNNPFTIATSCALYSGTVNVNNLTIGDPSLTAALVMERYRGIFSSAPTFNISSYSMTYRTPINNLGGIYLAYTPTIISSSEEIPLISGSRKVTTLSMITHDNLTLTYPLTVGTPSSGAITLTRGIISTSTTNLITFESNVAGTAGTPPTYVVNTGTNSGTHGSYINGPVKINFPATGTTNRVFPLGQGFNLHTNLPSLNAHRPVTIAANGVAWNSQTITASIENAPSGAVNAPLTTVMGTRAYRLNYNGGPTLAPNHTLQLVAMNTGTTGGDNLSGDLADLRIAQAPALNGPWTQRSLSTGSGPFAGYTNYTRNTVSVTPGPITSDEYFAWATTGQVCSGTPNAATITGTTTTICQNAATTLTATGTSTGLGISYQWASSSSPSGPFNPISGAVTNTLSTGSLTATTYYIFTTTCSISSSTNSSAVYTLAVDPLPTINVVASSTNYCNGANAVTLTASGAANYTWTPASGLSATNNPVVTANPTLTTTYSVSGTSTAGCVGQPATITIASVPNVSVVNAVVSPTSVCSGSSATLNATFANNIPNYCIPPYSTGSGSGDYINSVSLNTFTNANSGPLPSPFYTLYPASSYSTSLVAGNVYTLTVQSGTYNGTSNFGAFIDFNQNGDLNDPGEKIAQINLSGSLATGSATFTVPASAYNGMTILRVREVFANTNIDPCSSATFGETEDYYVDITGGVNPSASFNWSPSTFLSSTNTQSTTANSATSSVNYTVQVTNAFGCSGQQTVDLTVIPLPTVALTASQNTTCLNGATISLTGSPSGGIYSGTNVSGNTFTPATTGTFTPVYSYTDTGTGCSNSATVQIIVYNCAGIDNITATANGIHFYPNPANGKVTIDFSSAIERNVILLDLSGKTIRKWSTSHETLHVNVTDLPEGMYFLKITEGSNERVLKLIKQ